MISACRNDTTDVERPPTPPSSTPAQPSPSIPPQRDQDNDHSDYSMDKEDEPPVAYRHPEGIDLSIVFCHDVIDELNMPISTSIEFKEKQNFYFFISSKERFNVDKLEITIALIDPETSEASLYDYAEVPVNPRTDITFFPFSLPEGYYVVIVRQGEIAEARSQLIIHPAE